VDMRRLGRRRTGDALGLQNDLDFYYFFDKRRIPSRQPKCIRFEGGRGTVWLGVVACASALAGPRPSQPAPLRPMPRALPRRPWMLRRRYVPIMTSSSFLGRMMSEIRSVGIFEEVGAAEGLDASAATPPPAGC